MRDRRLVDIYSFTPDDPDGVRHYVEVTNAVRGVDTPWAHATTRQQARGFLAHAWDLEPPVPFLAAVDGEIVGTAEYSTSEWDNQHLAWLWLAVHPRHRRRGHGTELLEAMVRRAREEGRTSVGTDAWESEGAKAFAKLHGFEPKSQDINRRQVLRETDWALVESLRADAAARATAYELVHRVGATPEEELAAVAAMTAAINDAPTDDLEIEDEVFPPQRIRDYETAQAGQGRLLHRVVARDRTTGELAGHTVVAVEEERPWIAHQHDTSVVRAHRGHRLGLLLKAEMLLWLRAAQPQLETIDTFNAESNDHMIEVNELLGYRVMGRALQFQRSL